MYEMMAFAFGAKWASVEYRKKGKKSGEYDARKTCSQLIIQMQNDITSQAQLEEDEEQD